MSKTPQEKMEGGGHKDSFTDYPHPFPTSAERWELPTKEFLEASSGVVTLLDHLGKLFYFPRNDVDTNVKRLKELYEKHSEKYSTLKSLVESEGSIEGPGTHHLLHLKRGLELTSAVFRHLLEDYDTGVRSEGTQDILRKAYRETIERHHAWIVQNTIMMLFSIAPSRKGLIKSLSYGGEGPETEKQVMENMRAWLANFSPCVEEVKDLFNSKGLESEESVV